RVATRPVETRRVATDSRGTSASPSQFPLSLPLIDVLQSFAQVGFLTLLGINNQSFLPPQEILLAARFNCFPGQFWDAGQAANSRLDPLAMKHWIQHALDNSQVRAMFPGQTPPHFPGLDHRANGVDDYRHPDLQVLIRKLFGDQI